MKKITAANPFNFMSSGNRMFTFDSDGVLATDAEARVIAERFGSLVTIIDMEPDENEVPVEEESAPVVNPPEDAPAPTPEPLPEEAIAPEAV